MSDTPIEDELPMAEGASGFTIPLEPRHPVGDRDAGHGRRGRRAGRESGRSGDGTRGIVMQRVLGLLDPQGGGTRWWETALDAGGVALAVASRGKVAPQAKGGTIYNEEALCTRLRSLTRPSARSGRGARRRSAGRPGPEAVHGAGRREPGRRSSRRHRSTTRCQANMGLDDYTLNAGAILAGDTIDVAAVSDQAISAFNAEQIGVITERAARQSGAAHSGRAGCDQRVRPGHGRHYPVRERSSRRRTDDRHQR